MRNSVNILVFDLGRHTLHVSLLIASEGVIEVKAASEDNHLGGDDWDQRIVDWLVKDFKNGYGIDLSKDKMALQRLREAAEKANIELSQSMESQLSLPYISHSSDGPLHLDAKLTRAEFQRMTSDLLDRCKGLIQKVIEASRVQAADIDHLVLVDGSTRMSAVVKLVKSLTGGKEPCNGISPDETVAFGACLQAGLLKGEVRDSRLLEEAPADWGPRQLSELYDALRDAYIRREDLEIMLALSIDRSLDDIAISQSMKDTIFEVVNSARREGWLDSLVDAALTDRQDNTKLKAWARIYRPVDLSDPDMSAGQKLSAFPGHGAAGGLGRLGNVPQKQDVSARKSGLLGEGSGDTESTATSPLVAERRIFVSYRRDDSAIQAAGCSTSWHNISVGTRSSRTSTRSS